MESCGHQRIGSTNSDDNPHFCRDCGLILPTHSELFAASRALLASLPKCDITDVTGDDDVHACGRAATRAFGRGGLRYCDEHGGKDRDGGEVPEYPRAKAVRAMQTLLAGTAPER